jgi:NTE family protein
MTASVPKRSMRIGLVLGSGSARGWAHIGVIRELAAKGIEPDIVCGASTGALVGAIYVKGKLDLLESWARTMNTINVVKYFDVRLVIGGGFVEGKWLMDFLRSSFGEGEIESLPKPFGAVATNLKSGQEVWFRKGPLWDALRASIAIPGFVTPARIDDQWLVDGGVVNPVPVSLCRAMGADVVIAVNLNSDLVGRHFEEKNRQRGAKPSPPKAQSTQAKLLGKLANSLKQRVSSTTPGLFDVLAGSINIMQDRITTSRFVDHPPDVMITPHLAHIGMLEFDRASEAIQEGREAVIREAVALEAKVANIS